MTEDKNPQEEIDALRDEIDRTDREILALLNKRAGLAGRIGDVKKASGKNFYVPGREDKLVRHLMSLNEGPFPDTAIRPVWREIISASIALESLLTIGYLGPEATFTHMAARCQFGTSAQYAPARTITEVFDMVERGKCSYGVIPVENSTEGAVTHTLDTFMESEIKIVGEVMLRVSHNLLSVSGNRADIQRIYSHPQPLGQCRKWVEANFPGLPILDAPSTAQAAKIALEDPSGAAIAGSLAGDLYGLKIVEERIEDSAANFTRFLVVGLEIPTPGRENKTSLLFSVKDEAGSLYRLLRGFYESGVNLTKIESRPRKGAAWEYVFFLDCEGHIEDKKVKSSVEELKAHCKFVKILGSYPKGQPVL